MSCAVVPELTLVQVIPSLDDSTVPMSPIATKDEPDHTMPRRAFVVPELLIVQLIPSDDVLINPPLPTATVMLGDDAIASSGALFIIVFQESVGVDPPPLCCLQYFRQHRCH